MRSDPAFLAFQLLARRARRDLVRLVASEGRSYRLVERVRNLLTMYELRLTAELRGAQVAAWISAAKQVVLKADLPPSLRRPEPLPDSLTDPNDRGTKWPSTVRAAESVRRLIPVTPGEFEQLDADAREVAFTVARAQSVEVVELVQEAISEDLTEGGSIDEFRRRVGAELHASGLGDSQVEAIYRTHVGRAQAAGQVAMFDAPAVRSAVPYLTYSATHDSRVRPEHLALETMGLDGTAVYRADDPFWDLYFPPWAWNSVVPETIIQGAVLFASKAGYAGNVIQLVTESGRRSTVTPDHPILTRFGFTPAKLLAKGVDLLGYRNPIGFRTAPHDNIDHPPAPIGQVFDSLNRLSGSVTIEALPLDFHAHTEGRYSDVEVVAVDCHLLNRLKTGFGDRIKSVNFPHANLGQSVLAAQGPGFQFFGRQFSATVSFLHSPQIDRWPISGDAIPTRIGQAANLNPSRYQSGSDRATADAVLFGELEFRHPQEVFPDKLVDIQVQHFDGPVYDVQTTTGYMVADGIVESNCRCVAVPTTLRQAANAGVQEAIDWLATGKPPAVPSFVELPGFSLPKGWVPSGRRLTPLG